MITKEYAEARRAEVRENAIWFMLGYSAGVDTPLGDGAAERFGDYYADLYVDYLADEEKTYPNMLSVLREWLDQ